jgi:hypothetical protein
MLPGGGGSFGGTSGAYKMDRMEKLVLDQVERARKQHGASESERARARARAVGGRGGVGGGGGGVHFEALRSHWCTH